MSGRPPRSTLSPYTTLFRSGLRPRGFFRGGPATRALPLFGPWRPRAVPISEEGLHLDHIRRTQIISRWPIPARGFLRTAFVASLRKSARVNLHSLRTESAPRAQPITSGFSSDAVANSYSTTEHRLLSHRTPIATKVECCTFALDYQTL